MITTNFPDPCIVQYEGMWYSFATDTSNNGIVTNIQIAQSADFNTWNIILNSDGSQRDALPTPPTWVNMTTPNTWAPDVNQLDDGSFVMYYSATALQDDTKHCVGAATSPTILGAYSPLSTPFACNLAIGGAVDGAGFKDWQTKGSGWGTGNGTADDAGWQDWHSGNHGWGSNNPWGIGWTGGASPQWSQGGKGGQRYVTYKVDGNSIGHGGICGNTVPPIVPTPIILQAIAADGVTLQGDPITLLDNDGLPDDGVIEAPSLVKSASGDHVLFFSSGCYSTADYTVNYAVSTGGIDGPYVKKGPLLATGDDGLYAPGGADILWDARHMVFHADLGNTSDVRQLYVGLIEIEGQEVLI